MIEEIRKAVPGEEFSYTFLMSHLKKYKKPRDKVTHLLQSGAIIRVKKGLYIFGEQYRKGPYSPEVLANLIYGPSYLSLEYALSYYGMIPEGVYLVTSMTIKRNKTFVTPVGNFSYRHLHKDKYPVGVQLIKADSVRSFFIASPEKALADLVASVTDISSIEDMHSYLLKHMRIDSAALENLNLKHLLSIAKVYHNKRVDLLLETLL